MAAPNRIVRRLRLRAPDEASVRRTVLRLEDALRTASLHDQGSRLVLVRRLALGRLSPDASPQTLALALERAVEQLGARCVFGCDPCASAADAVWFRDTLEAHTIFALRLLAGKPLDAWYWPLAIPVWRRQEALEYNLRAIAFALAAREDGPAALPHWTAVLAHAGYGERLLASLHRDDVPALARAAGVRLSSTTTAPTLQRTAMADGAPSTDTARTLRSHALSGVPEEPHRELIHSLCRLAGRPLSKFESLPSRPAGNREQSGKPAAIAVKLGESSPRLASEDVRSGENPPVALSRTQAAAAIPSSSPSDRKQPLDKAVPANPEPEFVDCAAPEQTCTPPSNILDSWPLPGIPTAAGGLMFLVVGLQRCGYPEWWESQPAWQAHDIARAVFALALDRLEVDAQDPAQTLAARQPIARMPPRRFIAPEHWRAGLLRGTGKLRCVTGPGAGRITDASGHLTLAAWHGPRPRPVIPLLRDAEPSTELSLVPPDSNLAATAWLTACRRWLRRYAGTGLMDLVLRPAYLAHTPTHIDLWFDHSQADLRLRRAGLDLDPGWVPWLGRVVNFHYERID